MLKEVVDRIGFEALEVLLEGKFCGLVSIVLLWVFVFVFFHHDFSHLKQLEQLAGNFTRVLPVKD
jgi:hypothetical protein